MNGKKATQIMSVVLIALMLFSGFGTLVNANTGETVLTSEFSGHSMPATSSGVIHHMPNWLKVVDPSLRESVLQDSKATVDITVMTTDAGLLNKYSQNSLTGEFTGRNIGERTLVKNSLSNVPVTKRITVPYSDIKSIAQLPGVTGIYPSAQPHPAVIENPTLKEENSHLIGALKDSRGKLRPESYSTVVEHHAMDAWGAGYMGSGVNIAIVDTGVDFANPDLMGQWATDQNTSSPYYGWPIMWDPASMDLMDSYFTQYRYPYPIFASYGESSWYSDTSYVTHADHNTTTGDYTVTYKNRGGLGYPSKRVNPNAYGDFTDHNDSYNMSHINRVYYIGNDTNHIVSKSDEYHIGIAKDDYLTSLWGTRVGMLVVDSHTAGVYDTVYIDLDNDGDFTDEKPVNQSSPLSYTERDTYIGGWTEHIKNDANPYNWTYKWQGGEYADGMPDISGGLLYFISNTTGDISREVITPSADGENTSFNLTHGSIATDIGPGYTYSYTALYFNGTFIPSTTDVIEQDVGDYGLDWPANTTFTLNETAYDASSSTGSSVDYSYLYSKGYRLVPGSLEVHYLNLTNYSEDNVMTESNKAGNVSAGYYNYTFDPETGNITILFNASSPYYIFVVYSMATYDVSDFNSGKIEFASPPPKGTKVTVDYETGTPIPYSDIYSKRMGYDNFIPASGDVVTFFGDFDYGNSHGTMCASNAVGEMNNLVLGTAPGAKIVGVGDFYNFGGYDAWYFAVEGYDGNVSTSEDEAQIVSNSFGNTIKETAWDYPSRLLYDITTNYAPNSTFVVSAGNEGWGYGTVSSPGASPGALTVGAGVNMAYRWLIGSDGGASPNDWANYFSPGSSCYGDVADFSSKGPTSMGTPDPDVLAVGEYAIGGVPVNSAGGDGSGALTIWGGTSLASPVTAGVLALEYQAYYDAHNHTWPSNTEAKNILTSSCDDHGYDVLEQGAGWINASRAVEMASETSGVSADRMYWTPGSYDGASHEMSINLLRPGESDTTTMTLTNHGSSEESVAVSSATYQRESQYTFKLPTNVSSQVILKPDGLYSSDGSKLINGSMWSSENWTNADFIKITAYTNQSDAYPYMNLYDYKERSRSEMAFDTKPKTANEVVIISSNGETSAQLGNLPLMPGRSVEIYSNGTLLTNGTDYTLNRTSGVISFIDSSGNPRSLAKGEIITANYKYYKPANTGDTYRVGNYPVTSAIVYEMENLSGHPIGPVILNEGTNYTLSFNGTITLLNDIAPDARVYVAYSWDPTFAGNETAFASSIETIVNETVMVGHNGETFAYVNQSNLPIVPWMPISVHSNDVLLNNSAGGNYSFNITTGKITFLNDSGAVRPLTSGEVINITYSHYTLVKKNSSYELPMSYSPITAYKVWLVNQSLDENNWTYTDWTSSEGTLFFLNTTTGNITLNTSLEPGSYVYVNYSWDAPSPGSSYDGTPERIRMNVDLQQANVVTASIYNPGERVDNGLVLQMLDVNSIFLGKEPKQYNFTVSVEFYQKADWSWVSASANSINIPANGINTVNLTATVPSDASAGEYQGAIVLSTSAQKTIIPVLISVPVTEFPAKFGGNVPTTTLYENGAMQGIHGGEYTGGGDWRFYFFDVSGLSVMDYRKIVSMAYWSGANDDIEMYLMQAQPDAHQYSGGAYGNFTMNIVAQTKEFVGATDTLVPKTEILHGDMMDGPFEMAVRNWQLTGDVPYTEFHGEMGYMQTSPTEVDIYTNNLVANDTLGTPYPISISSNIDLNGGIGSAVTSSSSTVFEKQTVDPYSYSGGSYEAYLANAPNHIYFTMPENTISAKFTLYFYNGANDVDMGIYYDANGDGIPETDELIIPDAETCTAANPEVGSIMFPPAGPYIINAAGYDVAAGSLFDLTIETLNVAKDSPFSLAVTNETIPAGTSVTADLYWNFADSPPSTPVSTMLLVSPGCAPYALVQPIAVNFVYDSTAPTIYAPTPAVGTVLDANSALISASYSDGGSGIDVNSVKMLIDGSVVYGSVTDASVSYRASSLYDGIHVVSVSVTDLAGNTATYDWAFYVKTSTEGTGAAEQTGEPAGGIPDNSSNLPATGASESGYTAPGMYVTSPAITNHTSYLLTGITAPNIEVSSGSVATTSSNFGKFSLLLDLKEGSNAIPITVTDSSGVEFYYTFAVVLDTSAPEISFNLKTVVNTPNMEIAGKVTDSNPVSLTVNGMAVDVHADGSFVAALTLVEGENNISFVVTDAAGNTNSITRTITLDTTPPAISIAEPKISGNNVTITITAPGAVSLTVNGVPATSNGDGTFTYSTALTPGGSVFYIVAEDRYGNIGHVTYAPPLGTSAVAPSSTSAYLAGAGALILGLIIGIIIAMFLWKKPENTPEEPPEEEKAPEEAPEEEGLGEGLEMEGIEEEEPEMNVGEDEGIPELDEEPEPEEDLDFNVDEESPDTDAENMPEEGDEDEEILDLDLDSLED